MANTKELPIPVAAGTGRGEVPGALPMDRTPSDMEEVVARGAVESTLISPDQGYAALLVSRAMDVPVASVLVENDVLDGEAAGSLEAAATENLIPGYRILDRIGRGSQGVVYRAIQKCLNRVVALKVVPLAEIPSSAEHHRLHREARAIASINHPNIVAAFDYGESRHRLYLAMEYVDGTGCDRELARKVPYFRTERALNIVRDVALGLGCALEAGIIHRDIKPANILLPDPPPGGGEGTARVHAKIADLGLSRMGFSDLTVEGTILGTPGYMAPEQARGEEVDQRADIYALGATLYHMVTGIRPFGARQVMAVFVRQLYDRLADPRNHNPDVSQGLVYLIQGMMSRNPATRYTRYADLLADIDRVAAHGKPLLPLPPARDRTLAPPDRKVRCEAPVCVDTGSRILLLDRNREHYPGLLERAAAERRRP